FGFLGGPGERQIELDRRMIRTRIRQLEKELAKVRRMRATQRTGRKRKNIPTVALVGYTNAGKSTLFNRLTESNVYAANQLFATLDPTLRKVELDGGHQLMLSDTVGFVQELPHELVEAFRATLEEVIEADLIMHVRDAADSEVREQGKVVEATLREIGLEGDTMPPVIEVWNKTDLAPRVKSRILQKIDGSRVALSALTGAGINALMDVLRDWLEAQMKEITLTVDATDGKTLAYCHAHGRVLHQRHSGGVIEITVRLPPALFSRLKSINGLYRLPEG
ncbi:MAG: GTPase HflX, partial [Mariprofundaceae bacterium]|nr:GTPase HflX [Mariprofundaceae bacterium]